MQTNQKETSISRSYDSIPTTRQIFTMIYLVIFCVLYMNQSVDSSNYSIQSEIGLTNLPDELLERIAHEADPSLSLEEYSTLASVSKHFNSVFNLSKNLENPDFAVWYVENTRIMRFLMSEKEEGCYLYDAMRKGYFSRTEQRVKALKKLLGLEPYSYERHQTTISNILYKSDCFSTVNDTFIDEVINILSTPDGTHREHLTIRSNMRGLVNAILDGAKRHEDGTKAFSYLSKCFFPLQMSHKDIFDSVVFNLSSAQMHVLLKTAFIQWTKCEKMPFDLFEELFAGLSRMMEKKSMIICEAFFDSDPLSKQLLIHLKQYLDAESAKIIDLLLSVRDDDKISFSTAYYYNVETHPIWKQIECASLNDSAIFHFSVYFATYIDKHPDLLLKIWLQGTRPEYSRQHEPYAGKEFSEYFLDTLIASWETPNESTKMMRDRLCKVLETFDFVDYLVVHPKMPRDLRRECLKCFDLEELLNDLHYVENEIDRGLVIFALLDAFGEDADKIAEIMQ